MFEDDAIKALVGKMNDEPEDVQPEDQDTDADKVEDQDGEGEAEGQVEDDTDSEAEGDEEGDSDEADDEDEEQPGTASDDTVITWKTAGGEEFSVPVAELKNGYLRQQDYTHKTQDLAKEKEAVVVERQNVYQQVDMYAKELGALHNTEAYMQQLQAAIQQTSRADDPIGYQGLVSDLMMAQQTRDGLASRIQQVRQSRTQEQHAQAMKAQEQAVKELSSGPTALPNFGPELVKKMNDSGKQYGLSDEELSGISDPKYIRILHDAMKYRELQGKKPEAVKKLNKAPSKQTRTVPKSSTTKVREQFKQKPTIESMVALFNATK